MLSVASEILEQDLGLESHSGQEADRLHAYADAFRVSMRRLAASTCAVTVHDDGGIVGLTATSVTSLSMEPPSLLVSIRNTSRILDRLRRSRRFTVHVLGEEQTHAANAFAGRLGSGSKADYVNWQRPEDVSPRLAGATSHIDCHVGRFMPVHTHIVVVGIVERVVNNEHDRPLLYFNGSFHALGDRL